MAIIYLYIDRCVLQLEKQMREREEKGKRMGPAVKLKLRSLPTVLLRIYILHGYNISIYRETHLPIKEADPREKGEGEANGSRGEAQAARHPHGIATYIHCS